MSQDEEPVITEANPNINSVCEIPRKPFRITMEFPLFFVMLSGSIAEVAVSNIILYRTCWHSLNHTQAECKIFLSPIKSNTTQHLEDEVQKYTAFVTMAKTIIESVAPAILSLFLGVWSDTHGRKPLVTWPLFEYLYTRHKLNWALKQYTTFYAVSTTISFFGSIFGVMVVQKILRISDLVFAIVAFLSMTLQFLIKTFALTTWHMYLSVSITLFRSLSSPLIRSFITKILPVEDIAKVFALMCAIEGVSPLISPALYNSLYAFTLSTFPGAIYILSSSITGFCAVCLGIVLYYRWKVPSNVYENLVPEESSPS